MAFSRLVRALFILILIGVASPAFAQMVCQDRKSVEDHLKRNYGEKRAAFGITNEGSLLVIYLSKNGKTWTAVRLMPTGVACLLSAGGEWHWLPNGREASFVR